MEISKRLWQFGQMSPTILGAMLLASGSAMASLTPEGHIAVTEVAGAIATETTSVTPETQLPTVELASADTTEETAATPQTALNEATNATVETLEVLPQTSNQTAEENLLAEAPVVTSEEASVLEQIDQYTNNNELGENSLDQVTNVSQLRDVSPNDWAFEALRNLVERYGCIAGYPDGTYRGNRAMTRYEFAAGLNACLQQIERLLAGQEGGVTREDFETLQRLVQEFETELATLGTRVDNLEGRVAFLEDHQFSTTTKLAGEAIFGLASIFTGEDTEGNDINNTTVLGHRTRLNFETSFTGEDLLRTRLATGNFPELAEETGTREGELAFAQPEDNDLGVEVLLYSFPLGDRTNVMIAASGGAADDFASTVNALDGDAASGALSAFGTRHPIYYLVDGAGIGVRSQLSNAFELSLGYLAGEANDPSEGSGLFDGPYSALAQVVFKPSDRLNIGLTYIHSYNADDTGTGSSRSSFSLFDDAFFQDLNLDPLDVPTSSNSYGIEVSWRLSDKFIVGGWVGYTNTRLLSSLDGLVNRGSSDIFNYALTLAFPDLGKEGNLGGIVLGMEPKVTDSNIAFSASALGQFASQGITPPDIGEDDDTSFHIEAFYQYQVNDNISITPGVIWITAPGFNNDNSDLVIGAIRTTFSF